MEEWFKVLIHEIMHAFCLDFTNFKTREMKDAMSKMFNIKSDFLISETYSECWALIMNCAFVSYNLMDNVNKIEHYNDFKLYLTIFYAFELHFSCMQSIKILNHMNLTYEQLSNPDMKSQVYMIYKENTNVFAYYILKVVFLYFHQDFLLFCYKNNDNIIHFDKTDGNIERLIQFIKKNYKNKTFLKKISLFGKQLSKHSINCPELLKTNKMTIVEHY